jgi:4-hydroxybenzoate polyprenyltransferase
LQPYQSPTTQTRSLLTAMRLPGCLMMGFGIILGEAVASQTIPAIAATCGFITGFLLLGANMVLNQFDPQTSSQPNGSLTTSALKPNQALSFAIILASFGLLSAAYLGPWTLLIASLNVTVLVAYHAKLRRLGFMGDAFAGANIALLFICAGYAVGNPTWPLVIFAIMAFLTTVGREIMKSLGMAPVDRHEREPASEDHARAGKNSATFFIAAVIFSALPLVLGLVSSYYIPLTVIGDVGLLLTAFSMVTSPTQRNAKRNENYVWLWMGFGLLAFVIGAI